MKVRVLLERGLFGFGDFSRLLRKGSTCHPFQNSNTFSVSLYSPLFLVLCQPPGSQARGVCA